MLYRISFCVLAMTLVVACGGGGAENNQPTNSGKPSVPVTDLDWATVKPDYKGMRTDYPITAANASETVYSVLESLDLLHSFAFAENYSNFSLFEFDDAIFVGDTVNCVSGSVTSKEVEVQKKLETKYNQCQIDNVRADGLVRAVLDANNAITILLQLTLTEMVSGKTSTLSGYYKMSDQDNAIYNILIDNGQDGQLFFEDFSASVKLSYSEFGINYQGRLYVSDFGALQISTEAIGEAPSFPNNGPVFSRIKVTGDQPLFIDVVLQNHANYQYSEGHLPVQLSLRAEQAVVFDDTNESPVAVISSESDSINRGTTLRLSAEQSSDPDYDPLSFVWEVVDQPQEGDARISQQSVALFDASVPGDYTLRLTVTDLKGKASNSETIVRVLKNKPQGEVVVPAQNVIGESFSSHIHLDNDVLDGPFQYSIQYGPANMQVDADGNVLWDGVIPDYGVPVDVNFAVSVSNDDRSTLLVSKVTLSSSAKPTVTYYNQNVSTHLTGNRAGNYYTYSGYVSKLSVTDGRLFSTPLDFIRENSDAEIHVHDVSDFNQDGMDDFLLTSIDHVNKKYEVKWRDGNSGVEHTIVSFDRMLSSFFSASLLDYDLDGRDEIFIHRDSYHNAIYDLSGDLIVTTNLPNSAGYFQESCDFNGDGYLDLIDTRYNFEEVYELKSGQKLQDLPSNLFFVKDGVSHGCQYVAAQKENSELIHVDTVNGTTRLLASMPEFKSSQIKIFSGDFDGDGEDEVLVDGYAYPNGEYSLFVDNIFSDSPVRREVSFPVEVDIPQVDVVDIDKDGKSEILVSSIYYINGSTPYPAMAVSLQGSDFKMVYHSENRINTELNVEHWSDEKGIVLGGQSTSSGFIVSIDVDGLLSKAEFDANQSAVSVTSSGTFIYTRSDANSVTKFDMQGNYQWTEDLSQYGQYYHFARNMTSLSNGMLYVSSFDTRLLMHPLSGQVMLAADARGSGASRHVTFLGHDGIYYIADPVTYSLMRVSSDYRVSAFTSSVVEEILSGASSYSFAQLDQDPQPELIAYGNSTNYRVLDTKTLTEEAYSDVFSGTLEINNRPTNTVLDCFDWDNQCRNFIEADMNRFRVIDKTTGIVIWQSPYIGNMGSIDFLRMDNKVHSIASDSSGQIAVIR